MVPGTPYLAGPTDDNGDIQDFTPYDGTGMAAGTYTFLPVVTKGGGRCHADQSLPPYTVTIKS